MSIEAETGLCHCGRRIQRDRWGYWRHVDTQSLFCGGFGAPSSKAARERDRTVHLDRAAAQGRCVPTNRTAP